MPHPVWLLGTRHRGRLVPLGGASDERGGRWCADPDTVRPQASQRVRYASASPTTPSITERISMTRRITALAVAAVTVLAGTAACSKSNSGNNSNKTLVVGVDLPYQGAQKDTSNATLNAMQLYLDSVGGKAGNYKVQLKKYDDSTAAAGKWDDATCTKNADAHVANADEVAVMGTYNSGCAKLEEPKPNQDTTGPLLMVSHANTNPGLTKKWDAGEPEKYYPTGTRNYARVITTDDFQGTAAARFAAKDLTVKTSAPLTDNDPNAQEMAKSFHDNT